MKKIFLAIFAVIIGASLYSQNHLPLSTTATSGLLTVKFSTNNAGGSYASQEVFAIYIVDSSNKLVNTLFYRTNNGSTDTGTVGPDLPIWWSLIGSTWPSSATRATVTKSLTDANTGPTTSSFLTNQTAYWGNNSASAAVVSATADGTYKVNFEIANSSTTAGKKSYSGTFVKGATTSTSTVTAAIGFLGITISWVPVNTAIQDVEMDKLYSIYPNPAISSIFVSGMDIKQVDICSLNGQRILTSNQLKVDVSGLSKGNYLAVIYAKSGTIVKKIQKL